MSTLKSAVPSQPSAHTNGQPSVAELKPLRSAVNRMSSWLEREPYGEYVEVVVSQTNGLPPSSLILSASARG